MLNLFFSLYEWSCYMCTWCCDTRKTFLSMYNVGSLFCIELIHLPFYKSVSVSGLIGWLLQDDIVVLNFWCGRKLWVSLKCEQNSIYLWVKYQMSSISERLPVTYFLICFILSYTWYGSSKHLTFISYEN